MFHYLTKSGPMLMKYINERRNSFIPKIDAVYADIYCPIETFTVILRHIRIIVRGQLRLCVESDLLMPY